MTQDPKNLKVILANSHACSIELKHGDASFKTQDINEGADCASFTFPEDGKTLKRVGELNLTLKLKGNGSEINFASIDDLWLIFKW